jgi:cephalosporin hydroxylase
VSPDALPNPMPQRDAETVHRRPSGADAAPETPSAEEFHRAYYDAPIVPTFLGVKTMKCPLDLWVYQEIVFERRPRLILETGTGHGGTTLYLATLMDVLGEGRVITVDWRVRGRPEHPRITYLEGNSTAVSDQIPIEEPAMVILDSTHKRDHVLAELRCYSPRVSPDQYLIVEDTNLNGNPVRPDFGPGPTEAVREFLAEHPEFTPDRSREKFLLSYNPGGYLLKAR